jgi:hypothetical protein
MPAQEVQDDEGRRWQRATAVTEDGRIGGKEERRSHPQDKRPGGHVPELQPSGHRQRADGGDDGEVGTLYGDDQPALRNPVGGDPAGQDKRHQAHAAGSGHQR